MYIISIVLFTLLMLGGMFWLVQRVLKRDFFSATTDLQHMVADYEQRMAVLKEKEAAAQKQLEEVIRRGEREAASLKEQYRGEIDALKNDIVAQAHAEAEAIIQRGKKNTATMRAELTKEVAVQATARSVELFCAVLSDRSRRLIHDEWVRSLLVEGIVGLDRLRLPADISEAELISAYPLSDEQSQSLAQALRQHFGRDVRVRARVDPSLVAGLVVTIGRLVLDGSLPQRLRECSRGT